MKAVDYAQALYALKEKEVDKTIDGLLSVLKRCGALGLLPRILKEYESLLLKEKTQNPTLIIAKEEDRKKVLEDVANTNGVLSKFAAIDIKIKVDKSIIGGYVFRTKNRLIDSSHKTALLEMYRKIIS